MTIAIGVALIILGTASAFVGLMFNKEKHPQIKWVLLALILASCAGTLFLKYSDIRSGNDKAAAEKIARDRAERDRQAAEAAHAKAEAELDAIQEQLVALVNKTIELSNKLDEMSAAASASGNAAIASMADKANLDASTLIVDVAEQRGVLKGQELKRARDSIRKKLPLGAAEREEIRIKLGPR